MRKMKNVMRREMVMNILNVDNEFWWVFCFP